MEGVAASSAPESSGPESAQVQDSPISGPQEQPQPRDDFSRRFELLARKEREYFEKEHRFKSEAQKWKEKEERYSKYDQYEDLAKYDPIALMEKYGWTPEKLTDHMIKTPNDPYALKYQKKLDEMDEKLRAFEEKNINEKRKEIYRSKIDHIKKFVESDLDKFELVNGQKQYGQVFEVMAEYFNKHKESLDVEVAAEWVENYLEKELESVVNYKKLKSKMGPPQPTHSPEEGEEFDENRQVPPPQQRRPSTMTNNFAPMNTPNSNRPLSRQEAIERASKLIKWNE